MVAAKLTNYSEYDNIDGYYDYGGGLKYISDMNRDGKRDILDATAIQLKIAGLDGADDKINTDLVYVEYDEVYAPMEYPSRPYEAVSLDFETEAGNSFYNYSTYHLGHPARFLTIVKTKEQYDHVFPGIRVEFDEEFFETHWLVASVIYTSCDDEIALINSVSVLGDTLYVHVNQYIAGTGEIVSPSQPPFVSIVSVEKDKLNDVTNIVRVSNVIDL